MEEVDYNTMRYELDKEGYIFQVYFGCASGTCQAYEGNVPDGYETLEEWYEENCNNLRAWRIVNGNLACDSGKEEELQSCYEREAIDNSLVTHKELYGLQKEIEDIQELNSTQYTKATAQGKIIELNNVKRVVPKIKVSNINPYDYGKIDILANKKNMLPNDGVSRNINGLDITKNIDGSITLNGTADSGKNLYGMPNQTFNYKGVEITYENGLYTFNGTATDGGVYYINPISSLTLNGTYMLNLIYESGNVNGAGNFNVRRADDKSIVFSKGFTNSNSAILQTINEETEVILGIYLSVGITFDNYKFRPQLIKGDKADYNFEPYIASIEYNLAGDSENTTPIFVFKKDADYNLSINNMNLMMHNYNGIDRELVFEGTNSSLSFDDDKLVTEIILSIPTNTTFEDFTIYPMLNYGLTAMEYEKYEVEKLSLNFSEYVEEGLFPSDELYPSDELFPYGTSIEYILAEASGNTASINGEETYIEEDGKITLFSGYNVIYSLQDVQIDVEYCINNLALEGTVTKNNNFEVLEDGSIKAHNGYFSGTIEANSGAIGGWELDESGFTNGNYYINKNGYSNIYVTSDILIIQMMVNEIIPKPTEGRELFKHYDLNGDGVIDVKDMLIIQKMIMGEE